MLQMKKQEKNLQDQINEEEIGNIPEKEFRIMIVKMIQNLGNRMEAQNKTKIPTLTISVQHSIGSPSHRNQVRKRNKMYPS